jgi:hypothetical protein
MCSVVSRRVQFKIAWSEMTQSSHKDRIMKRTILVMITTLCLTLVQVEAAAGQTGPSENPAAISTLSPAASKVKAQVEKLGLGREVTVIMLDGREFHGSIKIIDPMAFTLAEVDLKRLVEFRYDETKKLLKGIGGVGFMGKRVHARRSIWITVAIVGGLGALLAAAAAGDR